MTDGHPSGRHSEDLHRNDLAAENRQHAPDRPHENAPARSPPHRLGKRERGDNPGDDVRENVPRRTAGDLSARCRRLSSR
jgi:hypothetical protein